MSSQNAIIGAAAEGPPPRRSPSGFRSRSHGRCDTNVGQGGPTTMPLGHLAPLPGRGAPATFDPRAVRAYCEARLRIREGPHSATFEISVDWRSSAVFGLHQTSSTAPGKASPQGSVFGGHGVRSRTSTPAGTTLFRFARDGRARLEAAARRAWTDAAPLGKAGSPRAKRTSAMAQIRSPRSFAS